jgi:hypothetical protein
LEASGLYIGGGDYPTVNVRADNITVVNTSSDGISVSQNATNVNITNSYVDGTATDGILVDGNWADQYPTNVLIENITLDNIGDSGIRVRGGVINVSISNVNMSNVVQNAIRFNNVTDVSLDNILMHDLVNGGISISDTHGMTFSNAETYNCGGFSVDGSSDISFADIFIHDNWDNDNGLSFFSTNDIDIDGVQCYNIGTWDNCIYLENTTDVMIRNVFEDKVRNSAGFGINLCDTCGTNVTNLNISNVTFNGIWVRGTNNKDSGIARITNANNVYVSNVTSRNSRWAVIFGTVDTGEITDVHAENCQQNVQVGTWGGGINTNIKVHDISDIINCGMLLLEGVFNSEVWNVNFSANNATTKLFGGGIFNSYIHDNYFSGFGRGQGYTSSANTTWRNNTFGEYLMLSFATANGFGYNNDFDTSNTAGGLPIYYYENRTSDITGLDTHNIICQGCHDLEMKNMDLGGTSSFSILDVNNFTVRNITTNNSHSICVGANATIIDSLLRGGLPLDCYWDYGQPFSNLMFIDSVLDDGIGLNGLVMLETNATLINTTSTNFGYGDANSFISRYWYIDLSVNPLSAVATVKDAKSNVVFTGSSPISFTGLEYVGFCESPDCDQTTETRDYYTPYTVSSSKIYYSPMLRSFGFTGNSILSFDMAKSMFATGDLITDVGNGLGGFMSAVTLPLGNFILILAIIGGVVLIFMTIAYVIGSKFKD